MSWFRYPTHNIGTYLGRGVSSILDVTEFFLIPARAKGLHKDQGDHNGLAQLTLSEILRVTVREAAAQYASHRHCRGQFPRDVVGVFILCFDLTEVTLGTKTCFEIPSHSGAEVRFVPPVTASGSIKFLPFHFLHFHYFFVFLSLVIT